MRGRDEWPGSEASMNPRLVHSEDYTVAMTSLSSANAAVTRDFEFPPSLSHREEQLLALQSEEYDVLVIGGGATGCGVALDSVLRGVWV